MYVEQLGQGAPVLFLHSSGLSGRQFKRLATTLVERDFKAILPDLGGHGRSPMIAFPDPWSVINDIDAIVDLVAKLDEPAHLVGHSYGALVALQVALRTPERIRSLALFEPVAFGILDPQTHVDACDELRRAGGSWGTSEDDHENWLRSFVDYWGGEGAWLALRDDARAEFRRVGWAVYEGVRSLLGDRTPVSAYSAIRAPMTLMTGEHSPLAARTVVELLGASQKNAHVVKFSGSGHMTPLTHASEFNRVVIDAVVKLV